MAGFGAAQILYRGHEHPWMQLCFRGLGAKPLQIPRSNYFQWSKIVCDLVNKIRQETKT